MQVKILLKEKSHLDVRDGKKPFNQERARDKLITKII
jgi:hypothetical protein